MSRVTRATPSVRFRHTRDVSVALPLRPPAHQVDRRAVRWWQLRDLIIAGKAKPSFIVSHRLPLSRAPEAYAHFVMRGVGKGEEYTKVVLKPALDRAA